MSIHPFEWPKSKCQSLKNFLILFLAVLGLCRCAGFSLVAASGGYSPVAVRGLLTVLAFLVVKHRLYSTGASIAVAPRPRAQAQSLCMGLVTLWHVGSSQTRDQTRVSCTGRWILDHWAIRKADGYQSWEHRHLPTFLAPDIWVSLRYWIPWFIWILKPYFLKA